MRERERINCSEEADHFIRASEGERRKAYWWCDLLRHIFLFFIFVALCSFGEKSCGENGKRDEVRFSHFPPGRGNGCLSSIFSRSVTQKFTRGKTERREEREEIKIEKNIDGSRIEFFPRLFSHSALGSNFRFIPLPPLLFNTGKRKQKIFWSVVENTVSLKFNSRWNIRCQSGHYPLKTEDCFLSIVIETRQSYKILSKREKDSKLKSSSKQGIGFPREFQERRTPKIGEGLRCSS